MGKEIERKFIVDTSKIDFSKLEKQEIKQGYIAQTENNTVVRVRLSDKAFITIKGANKGMTRTEFEYMIPLKDPHQMLEEFCDKKIEKNRYIVDAGNNLKWEIDEFLGDNEGLVIAEIELENENQTFETPEWIVEEVTNQERFYNNKLLDNPYKNWK